MISLTFWLELLSSELDFSGFLGYDSLVSKLKAVTKVLQTEELLTSNLHQAKCHPTASLPSSFQLSCGN